jgi:hypothetical protein
MDIPSAKKNNRYVFKPVRGIARQQDCQSIRD